VRHTGSDIKIVSKRQNSKKQTNSGLKQTNSVQIKQPTAPTNGKGGLHSTRKAQKVVIKDEIVSKDDGRSERWCFTAPRGQTEIEEQLHRLRANPEVQVLCVGAETGEETNYEQIEEQVKELLTKESHIEKAKGTTKRDIEFCGKQHQVKYEVNVHQWRPTNDQIEIQKKKDDRTRIKDAETMEPEEFKQKWPTEWNLRRTNVEKTMIESMGKAQQSGTETSKKRISGFGDHPGWANQGGP
jgi:hypothetical protein